MLWSFWRLDRMELKNVNVDVGAMKESTVDFSVLAVELHLSTVLCCTWLL